MLKDHNHDLIHQLSEISDSAWRMGEYLKSAEACESCKSIWQKFLADYEAHIVLLEAEIKRHVQENKFD